MTAADRTEPCSGEPTTPIEGGVATCWRCGHRLTGFPAWLPERVACVLCPVCEATIRLWREGDAGEDEGET